MYYRPLPDVIREAHEWAISPHPRLPTGYPFFDDRTDGGAAPGEVILFTARSSVGKTTFALNVMENLAGTPTAMFSLEMHGRYIAQRLAAMHNLTTTHEVVDLAKRGDNTPFIRLA